MKINYPLILLCFAVGPSIASYRPTACNPIQPAEKIDWDRIEGTWYEFMKAGTSGERHRCFNWMDFAKTDDGFTFETQVMEKGKLPYYIPAYAASNEDGSYSVVNELDENPQEYTFLTDYNSYLISTHCNGNSGLEISVQTSTPELGGEEFMKIMDLLSSHGVSSIYYLREECAHMHNGGK